MAESLNEVISGLEPSTQYEVRVRAVNSANMSGNSSQVEVFTELPLGKYYYFYYYYWFIEKCKHGGQKA